MPQSIRLQVAAILGLMIGVCGTQAAHVIWQRHLRHTSRAAFVAQEMQAGRHAAFVQRSRGGDVDLLFLGDSLIDWFKDAPAWSRFAGAHTANFGMMSDTGAGMLWRIRDGEIAGLSPRVIVIEAGTNDLASQDNDGVVHGVRALVAELHSECPSSAVLLVSILPRNDGGDLLLARIRSINSQLSATDGITFIDVWPALTNSSGRLAPECTGPDGVHLTPEGYHRWADAMEPIIDRLMAAKQQPAG